MNSQNIQRKQKTVYSAKRDVLTNADWNKLPKNQRHLLNGLVSRLADWMRSTRSLCVNDDQVRGALMLAYQQYMDGMGRDCMHWIGITEEELNEWHRSGDLPKRLRVRRMWR